MGEITEAKAAIAGLHGIHRRLRPVVDGLDRAPQRTREMIRSSSRLDEVDGRAPAVLALADIALREGEVLTALNRRRAEPRPQHTAEDEPSSWPT